jgi:hypothetical protein
VAEELLGEEWAPCCAIEELRGKRGAEGEVGVHQAVVGVFVQGGQLDLFGGRVLS